MTGAEPRRSAVQYPGGLAARYGWTGSGQGAALFALTETGGTLADLGSLEGPHPERSCRAELRVEGPRGTWTVRLASAIYDQPSGLLWDSAGLLIVKYGFRCYAFESGDGALRWSFGGRTPLLTVLGSPRLGHVLVQGEIETTALREDGSIAWRAAHADVVTAAELVGGRLVLGFWGGTGAALDPATGRPVG